MPSRIDHRAKLERESIKRIAKIHAQVDRTMKQSAKHSFVSAELAESQNTGTLVSEGMMRNLSLKGFQGARRGKRRA